MTWAAWLMGIAGPMVLRVLAQLGIGLLTYTGVDTGLNALITQAQTSYSGISADVLGLASMAGIPACLGIIAGAMTSRIAVWVALSATRWITKGAA